MSNIVNILRKKRASSRRHYSTNREKKRTISRKNSIVIILPKKTAAAHAYLALNLDNICAQKRAKYVLAEPKPDVKHNYVITVIYLIISNFNHI